MTIQSARVFTSCTNLAHRAPLPAGRHIGFRARRSCIRGILLSSDRSSPAAGQITGRGQPKYRRFLGVRSMHATPGSSSCLGLPYAIPDVVLRRVRAVGAVSARRPRLERWGRRGLRSPPVASREWQVPFYGIVGIERRGSAIDPASITGTDGRCAAVRVEETSDSAL
jgi:hypothetical protein